MGLKLTVGYDDKITVGDNIVITVKSLSSKQVCLGFDAPRSVEIHTEFADKSKQNKNLAKAQSLSPETQRNNTLLKNRGNRK